ncbi:MAG: TfoX/Sxy family protein [Planctomycetaceae bacterium]
MAYDKQIAERIRVQLARRRNLEEKKLFGGIGFLHRGNMLVGAWKDSLVVRVGPEQYEAALQQLDASEFDITGRPMRGWVLVGPKGIANADDLGDWIDRALKYVSTLPAKSVSKSWFAIGISRQESQYADAATALSASAPPSFRRSPAIPERQACRCLPARCRS